MWRYRLRLSGRPFVAIGLLFMLVWPRPEASPASRKQAEEPRPGGVLRIGALSPGAFRANLDPAGDGPAFLLEQVYDGLVRLDDNLKVMPALAEYWVISDDGRTYTFYLRQGVKFHHGRELEAEDVKFSLERLVRKETAGKYAQYFLGKVLGAQDCYDGKAKDVAGFRVRDRSTFEIEWLSPQVSALYLLSMSFCQVLPRDLVLRQGRAFFEKPSGTGPFRFAYWLRSPRLEIVGARLERNDDYFGRKAFVDAVEFSPFYTLDHFLSREVDIIPYISERLADSDCRVLEDESFSPVYLGMSCHIPPLDMPVVRRALALAVNKKEIARAAFRLDVIPRVTNNFIPAKLPGFFPADQNDTYRPAEAKKMLEKEGFINETSFPSFNLFFERPRQDEDIKIYRILKNDLAGLGIRLELRYYDSVADLKASPDPYLVVIRWSMAFPDAENIIGPLFCSLSSPNRQMMHYSNPSVDELARKSAGERSWTERIGLFRRIETILNEDMPAVPLFSRDQRLALQVRLRGITTPAFGFPYLQAKEAWLAK
jgi:ABC-type transport system substrate-binding protein